MIVVGSYGEAPLKGAILGTTAYKLLHSTERPVLVVPEAAAANGRCGSRSARGPGPAWR